jgi:hypothetical protein
MSSAMMWVLPEFPMPTYSVQRLPIAFDVDPVEPATTPLPLCKTHEAVRWLLDCDIESCCDYHGSVVAEVNYHPLLAAV